MKEARNQQQHQQYIPMLPRANSHMEGCRVDCPNLIRIAELQNELAYYKKRCEVFESRSTMVNQSCLRMSIQMTPSFPGLEDEKVEVSRQNKEKLLEFSQKIQSKMQNYGKKFQMSLPKSQIKSLIEDNSLSDRLGEIQFFGNHTSVNDQPMVHEQVFESRLNIRQPEISTFKPTQPVNLHLMSDLCIFGITSEDVQQISKNKVIEREPYPKLVYSLYKFADKQYYHNLARYFFPTGSDLKRVRRERRLQQVNQIMFHSIKKQSSFVYGFTNDSKMCDFSTLSNQQLQLLDMVNPQRKLFFICMKINEFSMVETTQDNKSSLIEAKGSEQVEIPSAEKKKEKPKSNDQMYSYKRIIAAVTYLPFFEFFQSVLISLFNQLKIERLHLFQNKVENLGPLDCQFISERFQNIYCKYIDQFNQARMVFNYNYQFVLSVADAIKLSTQRGQIAHTNLGGWVFAVLRMFNKDTFYDVLSSILTDQQVIFVCDNLHILTYTIYLFSEILCKPFHYPHACIYIEPVDESEGSFQQAPSPLILGLCKSSKQFQQMELPQDSNRILVFLSEQAEVRYSRREKYPRSQKLKKIVKDFYKKFDKGILFFKRKKQQSEYAFNASKEQKDMCITFISEINYFFQQEVVRDLPDAQAVTAFRQKIQNRPPEQTKDQASLVAEFAQKEVIKKKKQKDPLLEQFMKNQSFLRYFFSQHINFE